MASKRSFPTPLTVIMIVIILAAIATWFIPPGTYNRLTFDKDHFTLTTNAGNLSLPATQKTLDSLDIKIALEKFQDGDIRKPVAVPGTYHSETKNAQGFTSIIEAPFKGMYDVVDIIFFILI